MINNRLDLDITTTLKYTEELKAELLSSVGELYTSMTKGDVTTSDRSEILSQIIVDTYLLAEKLGVSNNALDSKVLNRIRLELLDDDNSNDAKASLLLLAKHIDKNRDLK